MHEFRKQNRHRTPPPSRKELWAVFAEKVSLDPHFEKLTEILDHLDTCGTLISTYYELGHTNSHLGHYLVRIVCKSTLNNTRHAFI